MYTTCFGLYLGHPQACQNNPASLKNTSNQRGILIRPLTAKHLLTYLLTYAMVQSPSWESNWFAASQEIPRISRNSKVHYRIHKRPPPVSILGQPNPFHIPTSHLLEIHRNIIHPSAPRSPQWSPSLRFPHQDPIHPPLLTHTRHMPSPSYSRFYHPHNIGWGVMTKVKNKNYFQWDNNKGHLHGNQTHVWARLELKSLVTS